LELKFGWLSAGTRHLREVRGGKMAFSGLEGNYTLTQILHNPIRKSTVRSGVKRTPILKDRGFSREQGCQKNNMRLAFTCQRNNLTSTQFPFYINVFQGHAWLAGLFLSTCACGA
jgi:hypothetical protein